MWEAMCRRVVLIQRIKRLIKILQKGKMILSQEAQKYHLETLQCLIKQLPKDPLTDECCKIASRSEALEEYLRKVKE